MKSALTDLQKSRRMRFPWCLQNRESTFFNKHSWMQYEIVIILVCIDLCFTLNCMCFRPQNLIAQSQSGTGKTAAFVLAMLSQVDPAFKWAQVSVKAKKVLRKYDFNLELKDLNSKHCLTYLIFFPLLLFMFIIFFQCLCISPTYELALQTGKVIEQMGKFYSEVKLAYAVRGHRSKWLHSSLTI